MPTRSSDRFPTVRTEGAILPADLLQRIAVGERGLLGLTPSSYHLIEGEKLNEATNRAWNRLQSAWVSFRAASDKLSPTDLGVGTTRERWLLPLFQEFGYGRLQPLKDAFTVQEKYYPISHVWGHVPIHLIGCRMDLDKRAAGSPSSHSLAQEFLNRSEAHLWGFVSNGLKLRILRDNIRLTRQAYVEFDLQAIFDGKVYADFSLLWRLCHQSRVEAEKPHECWLEQWSKAAQHHGLRVLDQLRGGVEQAIAALGSGFLACPANQRLRDQLRAGKLDAQDYYRQLLRLVYRLLFLFVAEDRELLFAPEATDAARNRYNRFYSTTRSRQQAERLRGTQHTDLYQVFSVVMVSLGSATGCPDLGLPALGSFLFSPQAVPDLEGCQLTNVDLLTAIRALALTSDGQALRPVDYRNLGSEELGSIYESLLELHPSLHSEAGTFELHTASGHERKTTGSYYTPTSLITSLLDSALDPVLDAAARQPDAEAAVLALKVCDPACGSGHFLIAAAHRIAKRLAYVRTSEEEPPPEAVRTALRDVIGHCVDGVDINPMAMELCKVALWMEALTPGKPLSFLDHHVQCGNSLFGATPALLSQGIPDAAFEPIEGDDKALCRGFKKQNKDARQGQGSLFDGDDEPWNRMGDLATAMQSLERESDDTLAGVQRKQDRYADLVRSSGYQFGRLWADAWCAAFVWRKDRTFDFPITERIFRQVQRSPHHLTPWMRNEIQRLAGQYGFFHWHLTFPDVFHVPGRDEKAENEVTGWSGGFNVILSNPPWERIKLQEKEWFAERAPFITAAATESRRRRLISELAVTAPDIYRGFIEARRQSDAEGTFVRQSGLFPLCGRGDVNTYALFAELNRTLVKSEGRVGCIVPTGIATDLSTQFFFQDLVRRHSLHSYFGFKNEKFLFPKPVEHTVSFGLLTMVGRDCIAGPMEFCWNAWTVEEMNDPQRRIILTAEDIAHLNPNTLTCPVFLSARDAEITKSIYVRIPPLVHGTEPAGNPWGLRYLEMFHSAHDSDAFQPASTTCPDGDALLPYYEAKLMNHYDHRWAVYDGDQTSSCNRGDPDQIARGKYVVARSRILPKLLGKWEKRWRVAWRDVARTTDSRTFIVAVIPEVVTSDKLPVAAFSEPKFALPFVALSTSFVVDYVARQKFSGAGMKFHIVKQLAMIPPSRFSDLCEWIGRSGTIGAWILPRVLELIYTAWDLEPFARDFGCNGPPFRWNDDRRFHIRCELDAAFFHLYGISRDDVAYILDTFSIVKRKDMEKHGEYRTQRVILELYDTLAKAVRTGQPYQTSLNPPPADPYVAHPPKRPVPTRREIQRFRAVSYIVLLLRTWNMPVSRAALEPAIVLMLNEVARRAILGQLPPQTANNQPRHRAEYVTGLDGLLAEMQVSRFISVETIRGQQVLRLGPEAPATDSAPAEDLQKARETLQALDKLGEDRALVELQEIVHETYDLVS